MTDTLIGFVGDVLVNRETPDKVFGEIGEVLAVPDILFGNLEGVYTDDPKPATGSLAVMTAPAHNLDVYANVGFNVMSMANNHIMDVGAAAMLETRSRLRDQGVATCGAGPSLTEAREPAIVTSRGLRIAFLAYASVFPHGHEAGSSTPGLAPMRAYNQWRDPLKTIYTPGLTPLVTTVPDHDDLTHLAADITAARQRADLVIVSFHWGDHSRPYHLTDHEVRTARWSIDTGADMVIGHHHHTLRGMEWYQGRPILYGLSHFVFDMRMTWNDEQYVEKLAEWDPGRAFASAPYSPGPRAGWPLLPMHPDSRMTVLAWAATSRGRIDSIGLLPCHLMADGLVHPLDLDSSQGKQVTEYIEACNRTQGLGVQLVADHSFSLAGFGTLRVVPN